VLSGSEMTAWNNLAALPSHVVVAMLFDWRNRGSVHAAYLWGSGTILGMAVAIEGLAALPPVVRRDLLRRVAVALCTLRKFQSNCR
jgi:hypothetical protein